MASSTRADNFFKAVLGAFALVGLAVTIGMGHSLVDPVKLRADWSRNAAQPAPALSADVDDTAPTSDEVPDPSGGSPAAAEEFRLDLEQAHEAFYQGAVFLDSRPRSEFDVSRVEGSMHLTSQTISAGQAGEVLDTLVGFGFSQPIVIYCHGGDCDASENTARELLEMGFTNIRVMTAGFDEWEAAGFEVEGP